MKWLSIVSIFIGICLMLLGGLWLLQGLGVVQIDPIACIGECETVSGPNTTWQLLGAAAMIVGIVTIMISLHYRRRPRDS